MDSTFEVPGYTTMFIHDNPVVPNVTACVLRNNQTRITTSAIVVRHFKDESNLLSAKGYAFQKAKELLSKNK